MQLHLASNSGTFRLLRASGVAEKEFSEKTMAGMVWPRNSGSVSSWYQSTAAIQQDQLNVATSSGDTTEADNPVSYGKTQFLTLAA